MHGKADRHMKLLTLERESSLGSLWDQEQCAQFCSKDELWEAVKEEEMKIPWKEAQEGLPVPEDQYQERFWLVFLAQSYGARARAGHCPASRARWGSTCSPTHVPFSPQLVGAPGAAHAHDAAVGASTKSCWTSSSC